LDAPLPWMPGAVAPFAPLLHATGLGVHESDSKRFEVICLNDNVDRIARASSLSSGNL